MALQDQSRLTSKQRRELLRDLVKKSDPVPVQPRKGSYPLSSSQLRMWFLHKLEPESGRYHIPHAVRIAGPFDTQEFGRALNQMAKRHDALRTTFCFDGKEPVQIVAPTLTLDFAVTDLSGLDPVEREAAAARTLRKESARPFDLEQGPLVRAGAIRISTEIHILYVVMHHIVSDGWSLKIFLREITELGIAQAARRPPDLPAMTHQYGDYAVWQREQTDTLNMRQQLAYWRNSLQDAPPLLRLPLDHSRPEHLSDRGARVRFSIPAETARRFRELCSQEGVTLYAGALAAFQVLLFRYSAEEQIVVGFPVASRLRPEWEHVIGFFANTIALATTVASGTPFRSFLRSTSEKLIAALLNQELPFEVLVENLHSPRTLSYHPIFQAVLLLEEESPELLLGPLGISPIEVDTGFTKFDLTLVLQVGGANHLAGYVEYSTDLFDRSTAERMGRHYAALLESIVGNPALPVLELSILGPAEKATILGDWNATHRDYPRDASIQRLFESKAQDLPDALAIIEGSDRLTYQELNSRANRIARALVAAGAVRGQLIGVALTERAKAIIAMLAVLKIGCAYLPLDPRDPSERNCGLLRDCKSNLVFTDPEYAAEFELGCARVLTLDAAIVLQDGENLDWDGSGSDAAYVMFTSGSTGRPKGVVVPHRAITRLVLNTNYVDIRSSDRIAQLSTLLFDAATFEIFGALLNGAALVIVPRDVAMSPAGFDEAVARHRVTVGFFTSSLFNHLVSLVPHAFHTFRCVLVGGEAVNPKWFARLFQSGYRGRLVNAYGPTESTTFSICNGLTAWESEVASVPIGRPISNTTAYVLDNSLNPVPPGVVGEICIGGDGLALGYLNDESATREKFVASRLVPGERLYRTGDLGRYRSDGDIECLGRIDRQLKIRGFRIEPHEIECVLKQHPAVRQAAVIAVGIESADRNLWAYVVLTPGASVSDTDLHNWLKSKLPAYLLPAAVILMDALPLTANGKLDHGKLPSPKLRERNRQGNRQVCTPMESLVLGAWGRILDIREISPEDNFFDLGGTSLLAVRMLLELERELARPIPVALILRWPTAEAFARALEIRPVTDLARLFCIREGNPQLRPIVLVHGGADYGHVLQFLTIENPIWTLSGPEEAEISETTNMEQLASLYLDDLRRAFPSHPPVVAGYCLSGMIGFEIARQFSRFHRDSGCIVLLDVPSPYYYWNLPRSKGLAEIASYFSYVGQLWRRLSAAQKFSLLWNSARRMYWRVKGGREDNVAVWEGLTERFLRAAHLYHPDPFLGKVVLLRASLRPKTDAYLGWRSFASQVMVIDTPSTHADVLSSAHARRAAEALISAANWVST